MVTAIVFVGINLANNQFVLHGVHEASTTALVRPVVRRDQLLEAVAKVPPCTIGIEASSGAHHWARQCERVGYCWRELEPLRASFTRVSAQECRSKDPLWFSSPHACST